MNISDLNNCCVRRGTRTACQLFGESEVRPLNVLTAVELSVSKQSHIMRAVPRFDVVPCNAFSVVIINHSVLNTTLKMQCNVAKRFRVAVDVLVNYPFQLLVFTTHPLVLVFPRFTEHSDGPLVATSK